MIDALKNKKTVIKIFEFWAIVFCFYRMSLNLIYAVEENYQTPRDLEFFHAMFWVLLLLLYLRRITYKKIEFWITLQI